MVIDQEVQRILAVVISGLVVAAILLIREAWKVKRAELNEKQSGLLTWLVRIGVYAAEQAWKSGLIDKALREEYVIKFVQAEADKYHLNIDVMQIYVYIKAAVAQELNKDKLVGTSTGMITVANNLYTHETTLEAAKRIVNANPTA